jgi:MFS family permease
MPFYHAKLVLCRFVTTKLSTLVEYAGISNAVVTRADCILKFYTGGQMIVTDLGEQGQRADALGKLGLSYGVGMVIGPFIGGLVTKYFRYSIQGLTNPIA